MSTAWKGFERRVARTLGGARFWANSGEKIDVESNRFVCQCKNVARMSLGELTRLAEAAERDGAEKGKLGLVAIKLRAGRGSETSVISAMTERTFSALIRQEILEALK